MATFRIHEDVLNKYVPTNKIPGKLVNNYLPNKIEQKTFIVKESKIPVKRLPLRANNCLNKHLEPIDKKLATQPLRETQVDEVKEDRKPEKENEVDANLEILKDISALCPVANKENSSCASDTQDKFYFPVDQFYITTSEYHSQIYSYLINLERTLKRAKPDYMSKQPELTNKMRSILVDWLSAVSEEYNMQPQTLHLTVQYIDNFLSRMSVIKNKFQLVGTAAMMIAAKYEEIYPPDTKEWAYLTADSFTPKQLLRMEQLVLKVLQFDVAQPTAYSFIAYICFVHNLSRQILLLAMYFSELVLLEGNEYIKYYPSQIAFAAVALARHTLNEREIWPKKLETNTGYTLKQLSPLIKKQHKSFKNSPTHSQQAIQEKYKTPKYGRVSLFKPKNLEITDFHE